MIRGCLLVSGVVTLCLAANAGAQYSHFLDGSALPGDSGWTVDGDPGMLVDLGGGNRGIQQIDADAGADSYDEFYIEHSNFSSSLNARFRLDSYTYNPGPSISAPTLIALTPDTDDAGPSVAIGIRRVGDADHWMAVQFVQEAMTTPLADLGPVVPGVFNEVGLYSQNEPGGQNVLRVYWNGMEVYNGVGIGDWDGGVGFAEFGASNFWGEGGTSTVTYDWVGFGPGYIAVPEPSAGTLLIAGFAILIRRGRRIL